MTSGALAPPVPVAPSRRERLRAATMAEIRAEARRLLVDGGEAAVSLRAVARQMGLTPAALYRYVDSHEELMQPTERRHPRRPDAGPGDRARRVRVWRRPIGYARCPDDFELGARPSDRIRADLRQPDACDSGTGRSDLEAAGSGWAASSPSSSGELVTSGQLPSASVEEVDPALLAAVL